MGDGLAQFCILVGEFGEGDAVDVFDDVVCGAVFLEVGVYFGDAGVVECGQDADFSQEVVESPFESFAAGFGVVHADIEGAFLSVAEGVREVFLDDNGAVEEGFPGKVGDAEAAAADGACDSVAVQQGAIGEFLGGYVAFDFLDGFIKDANVVEDAGEVVAVELEGGVFGFVARGRQDVFHEAADWSTDHGGLWCRGD